MNEPVIPFRSKSGRVGKLGAAGVAISDDSREFSMQIELENDCAITITFWKDHQENCGKASVAVWTGNGEHDLQDDTIELFKNWAELATGNKTVSAYGEQLERLWGQANRPERK